MLRIFYKNKQMLELEERQRFERGVLIELIDPTSEEIEYLHKKLKINSSLIHDALDPYEVPRLEAEHDNKYVFLRFPVKDEGVVSTVPFLVVAGDHFVMFVSSKRLPLIDELNETLEDITTTQKTKMVLQILERMHSNYKSLLYGINKDINSLSLRAAGVKIENRDIMKFIDFEESLNDFLNALVPYKNILNKLLDGKALTLYNEDKDLIEDLLLSSDELVLLSQTSLKSSINIRDAYSTVLTNNLNRVIKFLTSLTIILTVAVIIPSIYGMNLDLPLQSHPHAFLIIMAITAAISIFLVWLFSKKKWL
ncbi:MAG: magnesium transporter CorA family protein [bacterium]|nr:magnesium transporter CorA family protein [bacterium]